MKWENVCFVIPNKTNIEIANPDSFRIIGEQNLTISVKSKISEIEEFDPEKTVYDQVVFPGYSGSSFVYPLDPLESLIFYRENGIELILVMHPSINYDTTWMVHAVISRLKQSVQVGFDDLEHDRYAFLFYPALRSEYQVGMEYDLFATLPPTEFSLNLQHEPQHNIGHALTQINRSTVSGIIQSIEKLFRHLSIDTADNNEAIIYVIIELISALDQFKEHLSRELPLIKINIFSSLFKVFIPRNVRSHLLVVSEKIKEDLEWFNMEHGFWIVNALSNWYLHLDGEIADVNWDKQEIPRHLRLLPILDELRDMQSITEDHLQKIIELNFKVLSDPIPYVAMGEFQQKLGGLHLDIHDYANAETYFKYAAKLFSQKGYTVKAKKASISALYSELEKFKELAVAANLFYYTGRTVESESMGWSALTSATSVIKELVDLKSEDQNILQIIIEYYPRAKRPLVADKEDETTQVVELKLSELFNFITSLLEGKIDWEMASQMIDMHIDSLRFLKPAKPPRFMLMTQDGRLIDTQEAVANPEEVSDSTLNHLVAGALTAIRSILQEATQSTGLVKEINAGDSILLMEATADLVVVASATNVSDDLRRLVEDLATSIQEQYGYEIRNWYGDSQSMEPVRQLIRARIEDELL